MRSVDDLEFGHVADTDDEHQRFAETVALGFHETLLDAWLPYWRATTEFDRTWVARDGDRLVGTCAVHSFWMSLPGGGEAPCAGLTAVGVAPDWRRRGVLTRLMRWHLDDARRRGEPFAALYASEAAIYGRFGYGVAAPMVGLRVPAVHAAPAGAAGLPDVRLVEVTGTLDAPAAALDELRAIERAARAQRGGMMSRDDVWWRSWMAADPPDDRDGFTVRRCAVVDGRGYVLFRTKGRWEEGVPRGELAVVELVAIDPEATAALWAFLAGIDLVETITSPLEPADTPLPHLVADRNRVRVTADDPLWLRLVDVPAALAVRTYDVDDVLVVEVADALLPANAGTWRVEVRDGTATVSPAPDADPDLGLDVSGLGSLLLGGVRATELAGARRVVEHTAGALRRADLLFSVGAAPWNPFMF
ncbi:MAG: GNAT family N-acetyltransferase [Actinomycetes bacterium]